jgi:hypothetical protein
LRSAENTAARIRVALCAGEVELSEFLSGFSATPSYAGAPMLRTSRLAFRAHRSWTRLLWTAFRDGDSRRLVGRRSHCGTTHTQRYDARRGIDGQRADYAAGIVLGDG